MCDIISGLCAKAVDTGNYWVCVDPQQAITCPDGTFIINPRMQNINIRITWMTEVSDGFRENS